MIRDDDGWGGYKKERMGNRVQMCKASVMHR